MHRDIERQRRGPTRAVESELGIVDLDLLRQYLGEFAAAGLVAGLRQQAETSVSPNGCTV